jgi:gamma-glutamyltranspeptidase/glutathione hydrolase
VRRRGANAVDASVAAMLACCVAEPAMVGLGGYGGSLVAHLASPDASAPGGRSVAIDFDSRAPLTYRPEVYGTDRSKYDTGYLSITVPAGVAGLDLALSRFGTLPWAAVAEPAIELAENGIPVTPELKRQLDGWAAKADAVSRRALVADGVVPAVGTVWTQPALAQLLRRLSAQGPATFYHGDIPRTIVRQVRAHGGILGEDDFANYRPTLVEPLAIDYRKYRVLTPPPPSGGLTTLQILKTLEQFDLSAVKPWSADYFHLVAEAAKLSWQDRATSLGDPDVTPIPVNDLLSAEAAAEKARRIRGAQQGERGCVGVPACGSPPSSAHTVNIAAADAAGNVVSITATLGYLFGSAVVIDGLGLVMNHGMSRFDHAPGSPNAAAPGKRMVHNMAPTIVLDNDGRPFAAVGLPGGPKIVTVTAQLVISLVDFHATPKQAVTAGRVHAEGGEPVAVSAAVTDAVIARLQAIGHTVRRGQDVGGPPAEIGGVANVVRIDPASGVVSAASQAGAAAAATVGGEADG